MTTYNRLNGVDNDYGDGEPIVSPLSSSPNLNSASTPASNSQPTQRESSHHTRSNSQIHQIAVATVSNHDESNLNQSLVASSPSPSPSSSSVFSISPSRSNSNQAKQQRGQADGELLEGGEKDEDEDEDEAGSDEEEATRFDYSSSQIRDKTFLIAFVLHFLFLVILTCVYGTKFMNSSAPPPSSDDSYNGHAESMHKNSWTGIMISGLVASSLFSTIWLYVIQKFNSSIVKISLITCLSVLLLSSIASFIQGLIAPGVLYIVLGIGTVIWYYYVKDRIPFTQRVLHSAVQSVKERPRVIYVVYLLAVLQLLFYALWFFTFVSIFYDWVVVTSDSSSSSSSSSSHPHPFFLFFLLVSLYWTSNTMCYIGHCTTSGVVASWWLEPNRSSPTLSSFRRSCTTSLGSLIFAALTVTFLSILHRLLHRLRLYLPCCMHWIFNLLERLLRVVNKFALVQISIYGYSFVRAGKETKNLFRADLFHLIVNDNLCYLVLLMGCFISGVFSGTIGAVWAAGLGETRWALVAWVASIVGFSVTELFMSVIDSAVATTFVCWSLEPDALMKNRPEEFKRIVEAAGEKYAEVGRRRRGRRRQEQEQV